MSSLLESCDLMRSLKLSVNEIRASGGCSLVKTQHSPPPHNLSIWVTETN